MDKKKDYQDILDCIKSDQVSAPKIAKYFEDKLILNFSDNKLNIIFLVLHISCLRDLVIISSFLLMFFGVMIAICLLLGWYNGVLI